MTKEQVLTTLNERLAKRRFNAIITDMRTIENFTYVDVLVRDSHNYGVAFFGLTIEDFNIFSMRCLGLPNQCIDAYNLIEKGE